MGDAGQRGGWISVGCFSSAVSACGDHAVGGDGSGVGSGADGRVGARDGGGVDAGDSLDDCDGIAGVR